MSLYYKRVTSPQACAVRCPKNNKLSLDSAYHLPNYVIHIFQLYYDFLRLNFIGHAILLFTLGFTTPDKSKYIKFLHRSLAMVGYATQPSLGADSVKISSYQLALLYKRLKCKHCLISVIAIVNKKKSKYFKGNRTKADLRYGLEDSISPNTLIFAAIKS